MGPVRAGIILIIYLSIVIIGYMVLASPFSSVFGGFENTSISTYVDNAVDYHTGVVRQVFDLCFALLAVVPIAWFVVWAFHREPDWRYYR